MDQRKFNGGKRENAGRKKKYTNPSDINITVEKVERDKAVKAAGGLAKLKVLLSKYIKEVGEKGVGE